MKILTEETLLHVIDVQERLTPHIDNYQQVVSKIVLVVEGAKVLSLPVVVSEQYKKGLGETVPKLQTAMQGESCFEKVTFSACDDAPTMAHIQAQAKQGRKNIILCGIETHVCIMQTAIDLLAEDFQVIIVCDAVGSRFPADKEMAIKRLERAGAIMATSESILFELCRSSKNPAFKTISSLVKD